VISSNAVPPRSGASEDVPGARPLDLVAVVNTLRRSCPCDREQTDASLLCDMPALREEIGDVLFQVLFHARIASERSAADARFTIDGVADTPAAKLLRRHPRVFTRRSVGGRGC
jgi:XTP/dITP diphosphohydrolase